MMSVSGEHISIGDARDVHFGGYSLGGLQWGPGRSPSTRSGGQSSSEAEAVCRHCLQILTTEMITICKLHTIYLLILDQCVSRWGLGDPFDPLVHA